MYNVETAKEEDVRLVSEMYNRLCLYLENHDNFCGWKLGLYPVESTAREGYNDGSLYVIKTDGKAIGSVILNSQCPPAYNNVKWSQNFADSEILVVHTLCIDPDYAGQGVGRALLDFTEELGRINGYKTIRLDTWEKNIPASKLYEKKGYQLIDLIYLMDEEIPEIRDWKFKVYEKLL